MCRDRPDTQILSRATNERTMDVFREISGVFYFPRMGLRQLSEAMEGLLSTFYKHANALNKQILFNSIIFTLQI